MSVNNKNILRVWWGLTGFYPSAMIHHVFYQNYVLECIIIDKLYSSLNFVNISTRE